jgi:hypothetical protein
MNGRSPPTTSLPKTWYNSPIENGGPFFAAFSPASEDIMHAIEILDTVQYVVDKEGKQTAVLVDLHHWQALRYLLEELAEDESLGQLMAAVADDEKLEGAAVEAVYQAYLKEAKA